MIKNMVLKNPKRKHHINTRLYLKGFTESDRGVFIWRYKHGKEYNPGDNKYNNPFHASTRVVGCEKDRHAFRKYSGEMDYETIENIFEKLEKPSNNIFKKLRLHKPINDNDKDILSSYMGMMIKRVPKHDKKTEEVYWKNVNNFCWAELQQDFQERGRFGKALEVIKVKNHLKKELSKEVFLRSLITEPKKVKNGLVKMNWCYLTLQRHL